MKTLMGAGLVLALLFAALVFYNATPSGDASLALSPPLAPMSAQESAGQPLLQADYNRLDLGFEAQSTRSFCGPASIAMVLRAYGVSSESQWQLFADTSGGLDAFFTGMTLNELASLARAHQLVVEVHHADALSVSDFRELVMANLNTPDDYLVINYDRRVLNQSGAGHISPLGAYNPENDTVLILDSAAYKYPYTWVPLPLLYKAMATMDGNQYRGLLVIQAHHQPA